MDKNITIPLLLLFRTIELLECWNIQEYCQATQEDYYDVLVALTRKKQNVELREAYARIIYADSEDSRHDARRQYLHQKRQMEEPF